MFHFNADSDKNKSGATTSAQNHAAPHETAWKNGWWLSQDHPKPKSWKTLNGLARHPNMKVILGTNIKNHRKH
jgi:hypothetical protein